MSEVEAVERLHRAAQARLGLAVALLSKDRWASVQAAKPRSGADRWASSVADAIVAARELSLQLAIAYYRLARAVEIGATMGEEIAGLTLGALRQVFLEQALAIADIGSDSEASAFHALYTSDIADGVLEEIDIMDDVQRFLDETESDAGKAIRTDVFAWPTISANDQALAAIKKTLQDEAVVPLENDVKRLSRGDDDKGRALAKIEDSHRKKGQLGAGHADEMALRAGRRVVDYAARRDKSVLKFARGLGPNPCHFCAMLASRGFIYVSSQSASKSYRDGGMRSYHPNCHCFPIARWVEQSPLPPLNDYFQKQWPKVTAGTSGKGSLRKWRRWLAEQRREGLLPTT